ncbi:MAG: lytic transglycosylase domain-containing protein [Candidatus Pelethousia sp.]|nr:lytic transglycosylase domain-containing protein [Candidatus Pelethousia sp.]
MKKTMKALIATAMILALILCALWLNNFMEKRKYRLDYPLQIKRYSSEFSLDPFLVAAIIHCESGNRAAITSPKGAVGLMQIMPETGAWIAQKLDLSDYDEAMLANPDMNIRMGCWYLRYLMDQFGGVRSHVLAAYNAGPGNLKKWLEDEAYSQDGMLVDIPFSETSSYVEKVENAYEKYKKLYEDELD